MQPDSEIYNKPDNRTKLVMVIQTGIRSSLTNVWEFAPKGHHHLTLNFQFWLINESNDLCTYPFSFLAAILKMMAGLLVVSTWAEARCVELTTQYGLGPQYTRTKARAAGPGFWSPAGPAVLRTARYTVYSRISPLVLVGGSQETWAPSLPWWEESHGNGG